MAETFYDQINKQKTQKARDNKERKKKSLNMKQITGSVRTGTKNLIEQGNNPDRLREKILDAYWEGRRQAETDGIPKDIQKALDTVENRAENGELDYEALSNRLERIQEKFR